MQTLPYLELVYGKNILNSLKTISFNTIQNCDKSENFMLEQSSFINFLLVEKCKICEIYRRMYDEYGEAFLVKKSFWNRLNMVLPLQFWVHIMKIHYSQVKKKYLEQLSVKNVILTVFSDMKGSINIDFL